MPERPAPTISTSTCSGSGGRSRADWHAWKYYTTEALRERGAGARRVSGSRRSPRRPSWTLRRRRSRAGWRPRPARPCCARYAAGPLPPAPFQVTAGSGSSRSRRRCWAGGSGRRTRTGRSRTGSPSRPRARARGRRTRTAPGRSPGRPPAGAACWAACWASIREISAWSWLACDLVADSAACWTACAWLQRGALGLKQRVHPGQLARVDRGVGRDLLARSPRAWPGAARRRLPGAWRRG